MICKGFGGGWLPTSKAPFCKEHGQGRGSELSLCSSHLLHVPGTALAQGLRAENPHHTLKMQQGNSLEERGMRHRLQKQRQAKSKAKNKCLLMHWAWPVTPITWFFWLTFLKEIAFQGGWLGTDLMRGAPCTQLCLQTSMAPGTWLAESVSGVSPKQLDATLCCSL